MTIVMKQHPLFFGVSTKRDAKLFGFLDGRVKVLLVSRLQAHALIMLLEFLSHCLRYFAIGSRRACGLDPTFHRRCGAGLDCVWWVYADVQT